MMQLKMKGLKFPCPLHVLVDGPVEQNETEMIFEMVCKQELYDKTIHSVWLYLESGRTAVEETLKNNEFLNILQKNILIESSSLESTIGVLSILTRSDPVTFLLMGSYKLIIKLFQYQLKYSIYMMALDCLYSLISTHSSELILKLLEENDLLLFIILNGISKENDKEENELCGEMLKISLSCEGVRIKLSKDLHCLNNFLTHLNYIYQSILVDMNNHILLIRLCECIEYLTWDSSIKFIIESYYSGLLQ
ncbi:hypothetical protein EDI_139040 [Entamoeba dispar SAW760]|uniref:Uncharacterized protein n=1 Tax=Entamoeba dispar (strain ATCC PRA-260 / SAW760) TaxID=370354 RepID=B0EN67_ENTDS|nr:uncharacterized protein EDI_139040 [Entamoeba dispar SAW760]EDR24011.1 hypothetical protein EDI_139040 [Entamoeba dispar SAW760]|eukprot:EDR24011.1 hypothetical protein EDI_139040 [Entamoeba dispar SAW760]